MYKINARNLCRTKVWSYVKCVTRWSHVYLISQIQLHRHWQPFGCRFDTNLICFEANTAIELTWVNERLVCVIKSFERRKKKTENEIVRHVRRSLHICCWGANDRMFRRFYHRLRNTPSSNDQRKNGKKSKILQSRKVPIEVLNTKWYDTAYA